ncbi:MAG: SoxR reducing system RseC family protein [Pseudomonadota bacterium]|nr:SoxR reducing system RseC family protein [Pseudomonadota bacterium]
MIEERAIVIETDNGAMLIEVQPQSACGSCDAKSACGTSLLSSLFKHRATRMRVDNSVNARAGDHVVVGIDESEMVSGSVRLYLWPLLGLIGGAIAAQSLINPSEPSAIIGGLSGMALALWLVHQRRDAPNIRVLRRETGIPVTLQTGKK